MMLVEKYQYYIIVHRNRFTNAMLVSIKTKLMQVQMNHGMNFDNVDLVSAFLLPTLKRCSTDAGISYHVDAIKISYKRLTRHIAHLRNQFKSINTF